MFALNQRVLLDGDNSDRAHLQPGVVEGFVDCDPLSRVQHQHASHQVLGTL